MTDQESQSGESTGVVDMLRLLLEDRWRRDWRTRGGEAATWRREEQIAKERDRYERKAEERMRLMNQ